jgi:4-methyl-5(b-hydroxyethyl)-thiazole monophosphate biosynthesis
MKKVAVILSNGTEEIEGITPVDILRRAGAEVTTVSIFDSEIVGSHGIRIKTDAIIEDFNFDNLDAIVIPGGMPGAKYISENSAVVGAIKKMLEKGKVVAAICASPAVVLAANGLIDGKTATCYPAKAFIETMSVCSYTGAEVERDGNLITANGPRSAMAFSIEIAKALGLTPTF